MANQKAKLTHSVRFIKGISVSNKGVKDAITGNPAFLHQLANKAADKVLHESLQPIIAGTYQDLLQSVLPAAIANDRISGFDGWRSPLKSSFVGFTAGGLKIPAEDLSVVHKAWIPYTDNYLRRKVSRKRHLTFRKYKGRSFARFSGPDELSPGGGLSVNNIQRKGKNPLVAGTIPNRISRVKPAKGSSTDILSADVGMSVRLVPPRPGLSEYIMQGFINHTKKPSTSLIDMSQGLEYMIMMSFEDGLTGTQRKDKKKAKRPIIGPTVNRAGKLLRKRLKMLNKLGK